MPYMFLVPQRCENMLSNVMEGKPNIIQIRNNVMWDW